MRNIFFINPGIEITSEYHKKIEWNISVNIFKKKNKLKSSIVQPTLNFKNENLVMNNLNNILKHFFIINILFFSLTGCGENASAPKAKEIIQKDTSVYIDTIAIDSNLTRLAYLMAGMDTLLNYQHKHWSLDSIKIFSKESAVKYAKMRDSRLVKINEWNKKNIVESGVADSTFAFYPFSGGDFIHLHWLLPNANEYLMLARENVGSIPNLTEMDNISLIKYLNGINVVLRDIYNKSYFITKNMITDINNANLVNGMLPVILWAAAKTNHEIKSVTYFDIDSTGSIKTKIDHKSNGVRIVLKDKLKGKIKTLNYLSVDISNSGLKANPGVSTYLEKNIPTNCNSFVKSASYLLHYSTFTDVKDIIMKKSRSLTQDDTGIPYKYFDKKLWNIRLFGEYEMPVSDFSTNLFQKDLNLAYSDSSVYAGKLQFSLGYHWGSGNQNQMFTYKK